MEFIDMQGAECCERMDDYKTGHILIQVGIVIKILLSSFMYRHSFTSLSLLLLFKVSKEYSNNEQILDYWEDQIKSSLGNGGVRSKTKM